MKAGTTALVNDLGAHPQVYLPAVKEPHFLVDDGTPVPEVRARYGRLLAGADPGQVCGEASTGYTKLPTIRGVPQRAKDILGPDARFIYLVRDPVRRLLSHHYHLVRAGDAQEDLEEVLLQRPELIAYSLYAHQLDPWLEAFDRSRFRVVLFEDYLRDRERTLGDLFRFLGIAPADVKGGGAAVNRGETALTARPQVRSLLRAITRSPWYKLYFHRPATRGLRNASKRLLLRRHPNRPDPPSPDVLRALADRFREDERQLRAFLGRIDPLWDLGAIDL